MAERDSRDSRDLRPIFLIGFMGSGKTTVGAALAAIVNLPFIDLDLVIVETAGRPIHQIIAAEGESGFRQRESLALADAADAPAVVATGGGIVTLPENLLLMQRKGLMIWLDASFEICWRRILSDAIVRPLAPNREAALARFQARRPIYEQSGLRVPIGDESADETARVVADLLMRRLKRRK